MIRIDDEKNCCGCGACIASCHKKCINMHEGSLGHLFPSVDLKSCINCGSCERVCPMLHQFVSSKKTKRLAYASYAADTEIRFSGSSGGMFGVFADWAISNGYKVYGAAFDKNFQLKCTLAEDKTALTGLYKSKYLQSSLSEKLVEIKTRLESGEKILFVSTPCQVASLMNFLGKDYDGLITVDFFCHGVPSQIFFDKCLKVDEARFGGKIKSYSFREKKYTGGVTPHYFSVKIETKKGDKCITELYYKSSFYALFQQYISLRESCYNCKFSGINRASDITIGDFHEIDNYIDGINRFDGVSKVIINSQSGELLWKVCKNRVFSYEVNIEDLMKDGICFGRGSKRPDNRDKFISDYNEMEFEELVKKYAGRRKYWKWDIYYSLPDIIRKQLKKRLGD